MNEDHHIFYLHWCYKIALKPPSTLSSEDALEMQIANIITCPHFFSAPDNFLDKYTQIFH